MLTRALRLVFGVLGAGPWIPTLAQACAVCWIGASSPDQDAMARGFYWGILFLMVMPFAVFGSIAGWLFYSYRRVQERRKR